MVSKYAALETPQSFSPQSVRKILTKQFMKLNPPAVSISIQSAPERLISIYL